MISIIIQKPAVLIGDMRFSAKQSQCFMLVMSFVSFSYSFKYFHTADTLAALVRDTI